MPVAALVPGIRQFAAGRWGSGAFVSGVWLGCLSILFFRSTQVMAAFGGAWDERLAVATVVLGLVGSWMWSWRDNSRPPQSHEVVLDQWELAVRAFSRNRTAVAGMVIIGFVLLVALVAPLIAPASPRLHVPDMEFSGLSSRYWLGSDEYGRDVLSRLLYGTRVSLMVGFVAVSISVTIGTLLGAVAGFMGGRVDTVIMRFVDSVISFPRLVLLITILAFFERSLLLIVLVLGLTLWPGTARLVRAEVLSLREREFIQAAMALGYSKRRIILRHLIPNALGPVIVAATLGIGNTIILEAGLSFLGLGLPSEVATWGSMIADGRGELLGAWWIATFPGLAIVFTVLSFNLVGDGLRDALDPRLRS